MPIPPLLRLERVLLPALLIHALVPAAHLIVRDVVVPRQVLEQILGVEEGDGRVEGRCHDVVVGRGELLGVATA